MAEFYTYQKKREEFGRPCQFSDIQPKQCGYFPVNQVNFQYQIRNPNFIDLDNIAEQSEHSVNTERVKTNDKGMYHREGGWPINISDPNEIQETNKYRRQKEKEPQFAPAVKELSQTVERCILQNNQIDLFEEYFENEQSEHIVENLSTKTLMLFKDKNAPCKRSVSEISWHAEGPTKIAVSYAVMRFQQMNDKMTNQAYIWDINNPNVYSVKLDAPSPLTQIAYNSKIADYIGGGCYNGLVAFWDQRENGKPPKLTPVEQSHYDPVTSFSWLMSRTGSECVTTSTDGKVLWWDIRKLEQGPVEKLDIIENPALEKNNIVGGTALEYNVEAGPSKFLIGTEAGIIMTANKKPKKDVEITQRYGVELGRHLGPIYSINRSIPSTKYFLSVGDWSCKIWVEDLKVPIIKTKYHGAYLSDGCWSPTRNGAFFLTRRDGWLDVWDYYYRQNEIAFSHKISDAPLTCLKINLTGTQNQYTGKLVAIGDQDGTVTILELCESLFVPQPKEKEIITEMFDREFRKEKNLEAIKKQQELAKKQVHKDPTAQREKQEKKKQELIAQVDANFESMLKEVQKMREEEENQELDSPKLNAKKDQGDEEENMELGDNKLSQQPQGEIKDQGSEQQQQPQEKDPQEQAQAQEQQAPKDQGTEQQKQDPQGVDQQQSQLQQQPDQDQSLNMDQQ